MVIVCTYEYNNVCTYVLIRLGMYIYLSMKEKLLKLKRPLNRKDKNTGKEFRRWDITLDPEIVEELDWQEGDSLTAKVSKGKLIVEKE